MRGVAHDALCSVVEHTQRALLERFLRELRVLVKHHL